MQRLKNQVDVRVWWARKWLIDQCDDSDDSGDGGGDDDGASSDAMDSLSKSWES